VTHNSDLTAKARRLTFSARLAGAIEASDLLRDLADALDQATAERDRLREVADTQRRLVRTIADRVEALTEAIREAPHQEWCGDWTEGEVDDTGCNCWKRAALDSTEEAR
jgi:hypothetical protein